jgi:hypothetical protein
MLSYYKQYARQCFGETMLLSWTRIVPVKCLMILHMHNSFRVLFSL